MRFAGGSNRKIGLPASRGLGCYREDSRPDTAAKQASWVTAVRRRGSCTGHAKCPSGEDSLTEPSRYTEIPA